MGKFFTSQRFSHPQLIAALLLVAFLLQCVWLSAHAVHRDDADPGEERIFSGLALCCPRYSLERIGAVASFDSRVRPFSAGSPDQNYSAMYYLIAALPFALWPGRVQVGSLLWNWLARLPYLAFGVLLGASVWYVGRRLYGNRGGYIALTLYAFAPGIIRSSSLWFSPPEVEAAWGAFGAIFTSVAVAHTLYAPREVVLWNWRRIVLLGLSLALAIGSQFSLVLLLPLVLLFLVYLAPDRQRAALAIWSASLTLAIVLLFGCYFFVPRAFWKALHGARFFTLAWPAFSMTTAYRQLWSELIQLCPALSLALPASLLVYLAWRRTRYFGNTAPLLVALLFLIMGLARPHDPGLGFRFMALPFLVLFVAGVFSDLVETRYGQWVNAGVWGLVGAYALWSSLELYRATAVG